MCFFVSPPPPFEAAPHPVAAELQRLVDSGMQRFYMGHGGPLRAGEVDSAQDHRTAMSLAVAGLIAQGGPTIVRGAECVAKSFPEFFDQLAQVAGSPTVKTVDKA